MLSEGKRKLLQIYRENLRNNLDLDSVMLDRYIKAVQALSIKLIQPDEIEEVQRVIVNARRLRNQLELFGGRIEYRSDYPKETDHPSIEDVVD